MAAQDTELGHSVDQLPLKGVVLCCTSLSQDVRTKLADVAGQMGARHSLDLTADVTHLLVASITTPKYRYVAKERPEVRVLSPDFIEAVRKVWTEGIDVDVAALEKQYTLPTFFGLQICLTGISDPSRRSDMEQRVVSSGGVYHGDLTKTVTHLIVAKPEGAKYTHAKSWHIPVVSVKWYEDSLARGMALQEDLYAPELPLEQQGRNAFRKRKRSISERPTRDRDESAGGIDASRRKLRKSASMRFDSQSQDMWQSISAQEVQVDATELDAWNDESQALKTAERPQSKDRPASSRPITPMAPVESGGIFSGQYVLIHGFDESHTRTLQRYLEPNGATVVNSSEELEEAGGNVGFQARCLLMPHAQPTALPGVPPATVVVTEWWVERCILYKRLLDPREDLLSSPLSNTVVSGFANLAISLTGFDTDEVGMHWRQTAQVIRLMGATYETTLGSSTTVLVCNSAEIKKAKAAYAWKRRIPMVSADWLWDSLKTRKTAPFDKYKIPLPAFDAADVYADPSPSASVKPSEEKSRLPMRGSMEQTKRAADLLPPKRLSNTRKRHATPSLPLQPSRRSEPARSRAGPFILEDDDQDEQPITCDDQSAPVLETIQQQPLKEISPNRSQPRGSSRDEPNLKDDKPAGGAITAKPSSAAPPHESLASPPQSPMKEAGETKPKKQEELTSDLANILARQVATRPSSLEQQPLQQKRKHRPLGRNLSTISSNHSGSAASASPRVEAEVPEMGSVGDGFGAEREGAMLPPSTQLGYDTPEAEAHRRKLSKQMGTSFHEDGQLDRRIESVKTVKDSADIASRTAGTATGRAKAKRGKA
ncbi:hypothetical protein M409DRAFT_59091 [Zasmidium cellare ATCC 36951]|uniref:BRCT domain-containing protein n=1 Tax=Zasmidium cellare ATCC 36951 TaxID=1080233 RepID=A0A6A6C2M3_ZASCE|nr:uncharacterized protein M409DRAFT_59091 [Zasmidium cellare ATCC 36951]KAF2161377.1 hypothetical protein M409DRAFT_59091 [Zasmidium cellare ATCC 36951]